MMATIPMFEERDGRLFSSSTSPYPLPVDTPEQEVRNGKSCSVNDADYDLTRQAAQLVTRLTSKFFWRELYWSCWQRPASCELGPT
ncbi:hypothetical protein CPB84DRAFT_1779396 [Gymnopilus junonius]|uniref:Uncharacterized protein n=1 Tax=Gymnopilus junonius TaxID=109634 RepID=A0A9P5TN57_GYMJU|nr:hypothetical protein CPB84DRAFT_1779396 [Gymnopilus junonius]